MPAASYGSSEPSVSITITNTSSRLSDRLIFFVMSSSNRSLSTTVKPMVCTVTFSLICSVMISPQKDYKGCAANDE